MFAVLHIADFPLHTVLRNEPDAARRPAALFTGTGKKSVVIAANPAARAVGVELGMTAPQSVARCPSLVIRAPNADAEAEARAVLLAVGFTLSPSIEDTAPGLCTIDLRGSIHGQFEPAARAAVTELARLGLPATAGLARTPLLALYAARAISRHRALDRARNRNCSGIPITSTSKITSTIEDTNAPVLLITPATEKNFLAPLPLSAADPSPELAAILSTWGLRTIGDLTSLPRDDIVRRFGAAGLALWQRAVGGAARPIHPVVPPQTFTAALEFEHEIETLEPLLFILRRFLDRLALELLAAQLVAAEIELTLRLANETEHARGFRLPEPTADAEILFRALHTHLESLHTDATIAAVQLRLVPTRPLVRQQGLFETGLRDPQGFAETLARISVLVGSDRVGTPQLESTHRPDAIKLVAPLPVLPPSAALPVHPSIGAPLRRFRPPLPARLEFASGCPTHLWTETVCGEIVAQSPAYPSSGDWWQHEREWMRSESDIMLAGGGLYRLLLANNVYFIEGEYD